MFELREVLRRPRNGEAVKLIHRRTGRHKTAIRALELPAKVQGRMDAGRPLPEEALLSEAYHVLRSRRKREAHPMEAIDAELKRRLKEEKSFLVIHTTSE